MEEEGSLLPSSSQTQKSTSEQCERVLPERSNRVYFESHVQCPICLKSFTRENITAHATKCASKLDPKPIKQPKKKKKTSVISATVIESPRAAAPVVKKAATSTTIKKKKKTKTKDFTMVNVMGFRVVERTMEQLDRNMVKIARRIVKEIRSQKKKKNSSTKSKTTKKRIAKPKQKKEQRGQENEEINEMETRFEQQYRHSSKDFKEKEEEEEEKEKDSGCETKIFEQSYESEEEEKNVPFVLFKRISTCCSTDHSRKHSRISTLEHRYSKMLIVDMQLNSYPAQSTVIRRLSFLPSSVLVYVVFERGV